MFLATDSSNHSSSHSMMVGPLQGLVSVPQIILLVLVFVLATLGAPPPSSAPGAGKGGTCTMPGREYEAGQVWFRYLRTPAATLCVLCLCKADGRVNCSNTTCDSSMCIGRQRAECCDVCQGDPEDVKQLSFPSEEALEEGGGETKLPCLHNGRVFQDGQEFSSNATGLQPQQPNQCIHCVCQNGLVLCRLIGCPTSQCQKQSPGTKDCCPTCKDDPANKLPSKPNPVLVTIMVSDGQSPSGDCTAAGITYSHGSTWHPVIGPFGPMDCVYCKCQNSKIECSRLNCPPTQKLPCLKPIQVPGHCCPLCPGQGLDASSILTADILPSLHEPSISVTMEQKGPVQKVPSSQTEVGGGVECLPPQTNTLVYRSHASSSSSAYYQYAFQLVGGDQATRLLTWTVKDGHIGDFSEQYLSKEEFVTLTRTFKFKLQGATRTRFMDKFIRKAKRLPDTCGQRCTPKIHRLEQVLHLRHMERHNAQCSSQGIPFH